MLNRLRMYMSTGTIGGYFLQALPVAVLAVAVWLAVRLPLLKRKKVPIRWQDELLRALFVCYLTGLFSLVLLPANFWLSVYDGIFLSWWSGIGRLFRLGDINLTPSLIEWIRGDLTVSAWLVTMLVFNVLMFIPLGFFLPMLTRLKSKRTMLLLAAAVPLLCETWQIFVGRNFDVDDLICNFAGILIGAAVAFAVLRRYPDAEEAGEAEKTDS